MKKHSLIYTMDRIGAWGCWMMAALCIAAAATGAWWHLGTAAIAGLLGWAQWADALGNEDEEDLE